MPIAAGICVVMDGETSGTQEDKHTAPGGEPEGCG